MAQLQFLQEVQLAQRRWKRPCEEVVVQLKRSQCPQFSQLLWYGATELVLAKPDTSHPRVGARQLGIGAALDGKQHIAQTGRLLAPKRGWFRKNPKR
jgi:hypothetical protein